MLSTKLRLQPHLDVEEVSVLLTSAVGQAGATPRSPEIPLRAVPTPESWGAGSHVTTSHVGGGQGGALVKPAGKVAAKEPTELAPLLASGRKGSRGDHPPGALPLSSPASRQPDLCGHMGEGGGRGGILCRGHWEGALSGPGSAGAWPVWPSAQQHGQGLPQGLLEGSGQLMPGHCWWLVSILPPQLVKTRALRAPPGPSCLWTARPSRWRGG